MVKKWDSTTIESHFGLNIIDSYSHAEELTFLAVTVVLVLIPKTVISFVPALQVLFLSATVIFAKFVDVFAALSPILIVVVNS